MVSNSSGTPSCSQPSTNKCTELLFSDSAAQTWAATNRIGWAPTAVQSDTERLCSPRVSSSNTRIVAGTPAMTSNQSVARLHYILSPICISSNPTAKTHKGNFRTFQVEVDSALGGPYSQTKDIHQTAWVMMIHGLNQTVPVLGLELSTYRLEACCSINSRSTSMRHTCRKGIREHMITLAANWVDTSICGSWGDPYFLPLCSHCSCRRLHKNTTQNSDAVPESCMHLLRSIASQSLTVPS